MTFGSGKFGKLKSENRGKDSIDKAEDKNSDFSFGTQLKDFIVRLGFSHQVIRIGGYGIIFAIILIVVGLMNSYYLTIISPEGSNNQPTIIPTLQPVITLPYFTKINILPLTGLTRNVSIHTSIPSRPRIEIIKYTVQTGDSVFGIAEKFGLKPSTILWGNYATLKDTPHSLRPGQELNILPTDGTYHQWQAGEGLNSVAKYYGVDPDLIVNYPGNNLEIDSIGDYANPNIPAGTWLIIPGGTREFISWTAPIGVTRDNPAMAKIIGIGACGAVQGGAVGYGSFIWPADRHYLSGTDYSPETNHRGIDISGSLGSPVYASDAGVIVYAGWNDYGYGNMIIIDHGNDWQTLYAHLSTIDVACSQSVGQGDVIAGFGSTGNSTGSHLHFEMMSSIYGKVNPWNILP